MKGIRTFEPSVFCSTIIKIILSMTIVFSLFNIVRASNLITLEVNGRIIISRIEGLKFSALLQVNTISGLDAMGGATMVIGFDTSSISFKANPVKNTDYIFHNFCDGNYSTATVTRPNNNKIWINIDLPYFNNNNGTLLAGSNNWTDVVTIIFDVLNSEGTTNIYWLSNSVYWGVYDDDNTTIWNIGQFQDALNIPLPVELSSFTAKLLRSKVKLNWTTESEINNFGFDVERKEKTSEWNKIGFVQGSGNSNSPKEYSFADNNVTGGKLFFYRLKQFDTDGQFEYSDEIEIEFDPGGYALNQNYPNPFNPSTKISWQSPVGSHQTLKIYDVLGNEIATVVNEFLPSGSYEVDFDATGLPNGVYFYKLQAGNFSDTKKMILLK